MPDLLSRIRAELAERLDASRRAVDEYRQLETVLRALGASPVDREAPPPAPPSNPRKRPPRTQTTAPTGTPRPAAPPTPTKCDTDPEAPAKVRIRRGRARRS
jgi:hypothetical protein